MAVRTEAVINAKEKRQQKQLRKKGGKIAVIVVGI